MLSRFVVTERLGSDSALKKKDHLGQIIVLSNKENRLTVCLFNAALHKAAASLL